ncbi:unannotated protein [freshwater metagenome]|uniref:Unannotated protein n=1 Tax=freshwater metagenome TaxID=449393 RepID=A0A6J7KIT6_9ZZZZ|nr:hypothetical protein [Actinomycetota bacterium]
MDQSEFKPPVRLSMTDEEIYQALGNAQATEDGLAKAMAIVEEQANLREHDNQLHAEWLARMQASEDPLAKIAIENVDRLRNGLDLLPLTVSVEEAPVVVDEVLEIIEIEVPATETSVEPGQDAFEALLNEAASEATSAISVPDNVPAPAVTFDEDIPVESAEDFKIAADEDALVFEESIEKPTRSGWRANAAFWFITLGLIVPMVVAYLVAAQAVSFGSALSGFALGTLGVLVLAISAHFTAQRTGEAFVVTKRATFGVFGAFVPGLVAIGFAFSLLILALVSGVQSFDSAFQLDVGFGDKVFGSVSMATVITIATLVVVSLVAGFAQASRRWINIVVAVPLMIAFVVGALATRSQVSFSNIDWSISPIQALTVAGFVAFAGIATYGRAPKVNANSFSKINTFGRWTAAVATIVLVPTLVFAHFFLVYAQNLPPDGFGLLNAFALIQSPAIATGVLWVGALGVVALLFNLASATLEEVRSFAVNRLRGWLSLVLAVLGSAAVWYVPAGSSWLAASQLLFVGVSAVVGMQVADSLLRRGAYHESSLLRSYGFYGSFSVFALIGFVASTAAGLAVSAPNSLADWLGFSGWVTPFSPLVAFAFGLVWQLATGFARVKKQQGEVAEVELRKAALSEFPGFSE